MALRGQTPSAEEAQQVDRIADVQDEFFRKFEAEVTANPPKELAEPRTDLLPVFPTGKPPVSPARFAARAESYADSTWQGAQRVDRAAIIAAGIERWERRVVGHPKTEHCTDCPPLAAMGWQPIGTLPPIGDSECGHLCLCHFVYSDAAEMPEMRPKNPRPAEPLKITVPKTHKDRVKELNEFLTGNQQFNEAMKRLNLEIKVVVGKGG